MAKHFIVIGIYSSMPNQLKV